jgi:hypothetical protein
MSDIWDKARLRRYITDKVEESLTLDYKAGGALDKDPKKKIEVTKDVSAMANSAGGIIIYGLAEGKTKATKHLAKSFAPIDRTTTSKETLEHYISNIRPKIDGIVIYSVSLSTRGNNVAYVVVIPQGSTAHQAADKLYYKRHNFESIAMDDYEIRDVMGRGQNPRIELEFEIIKRLNIEYRAQSPSSSGFGMSKLYQEPRKVTKTVYRLEIGARNVGRAYAQYINCFLDIPCAILRPLQFGTRQCKEIEGHLYYQHYEDNTVREEVDVKVNLYGGTPRYGPARYDPVLPRLRHSWDIKLANNFEAISLDGLEIRWSSHADNAPPVEGKIALKDIPIVDETDQDPDEDEDEDE